MMNSRIPAMVTIAHNPQYSGQFANSPWTGAKRVSCRYPVIGSPKKCLTKKAFRHFSKWKFEMGGRDVRLKEAYRADSTYMPGLVIEDIKRQIAECRVVIAEIAPGNPNVYYEFGYADALNKPLILIADRKEGLKPFDVRAYRTIFYENSIGGKNAVEKDLRLYLQGILKQVVPSLPHFA
jgi:hypothetical protein